MEEKEIGLYVHIPFCVKKCYYCDFVSSALGSNDEEPVDKYFKCLNSEIMKYGTENKIMAEHDLEPRYILKTIYIGGGTPSSVQGKYIVETMNTIKNNFIVKEDAEVTIEVNPGTVDIIKLREYKNCGINRISIGLQACQDNILKRIGRIHTYQDFLNTYSQARLVGFDNISVDLMINLPEQTLEDVKDSVDNIIKLEPEHVSVYSLIVEDNTKLAKMLEEGKTSLEDDDIERKMYWYAKKTLEKNNYVQYEISNFAKKGYESRHNLDCWKQEEYIGVGVSASSFMKDKRYSNERKVLKYVKNIEENTPSKNLTLEETLSIPDAMSEYMVLGLRKIEGVNIQEFKGKFNANPIILYSNRLKKLNHEGLIEIDGTNIRLSKKGLDFANLVWEEFI